MNFAKLAQLVSDFYSEISRTGEENLQSLQLPQIKLAPYCFLWLCVKKLILGASIW